MGYNIQTLQHLLNPAEHYRGEIESKITPDEQHVFQSIGYTKHEQNTAAETTQL